MLKTNITYHRAETTEDLKAILKLQKNNLPNALTEHEKKKEGFLTVQHDFELLKRMNVACAHCIAKHGDEVVGYALSMLPSFKNELPLLISMFDEVESIVPKSTRYIVMGQICVAKSMRGQGVFRGLYNYMAQELKTNFDAIITEVDAANTRSSNAHKAVGFELLKAHEANNRLWELIILKTK